jgi:hypothetical protein
VAGGPFLCSHCDRDMATAEGCGIGTVRIGEHRYARIRYGEDEETIADANGGSQGPLNHEARCGDCNVAWGGVHHVECDMELCPRGHIQLLSCECEDPLFG